jgi:hypothetical protein
MLLPDNELTNLRADVGDQETLPNADLLGSHLREYTDSVKRRMHLPSLRPPSITFRRRLLAAGRGFVDGFRTGP